VVGRFSSIASMQQQSGTEAQGDSDRNTDAGPEAPTRLGTSRSAVMGRNCLIH
jgi:hypothetical protein